MGIVATDDFNRDDENPIAGNWSTVDNGGCQIISNEVAQAGSGHSISCWNADIFGDNQYSQAKVTASAASYGFGVTLRCNAAAGTGYFVRFWSGVATLCWWDGSNYTVIGNFESHTPAVNEVIKLSVDGYVFTLYIDGTQHGSTVTDTTEYASSGKPGLFFFSPTSLRLDDWEGGDDSTPTVALTGTVTASISEVDIVAGGKTIILTLTDDTFVE